MARVSDETLAGIGAGISGAVSVIQDNIDAVATSAKMAYDSVAETWGKALEAENVAQQAVAGVASLADSVNTLNDTSNRVQGTVSTLGNRVSVLESTPPGSGGGGYGPNWLAASDAPDAVKRAVKASGGVVSSGGDDAPAFQTLVNNYGNPRWTGTMKFGATVLPPKWRYVQGSGPSDSVTGLASLSGAFFRSTHDHNWYSDFTLSAGQEAAGTHGIDTNVVDQVGFSTGADACTLIERVVTRNIKGDSIIIQGFNNRDAKLSKLHLWNSVGRGLVLASPDGRATDVVVGTAGSHGIELTNQSANWHVQGKSWYSDGDGVRVAGARHTLTNIEAQDNDLAGIRVIGNLIELSSWLADSNSYSGTKYTGVHSGLEIGLLPSPAAGTPGTASGGYNITIMGGRSWDKNEGKRGVNQRYGVLVRGGVRGLVMVGVQTGMTTDTHGNLVDGIKFLTPSDLTHPSNYIGVCMSNGVRMSS